MLRITPRPLGPTCEDQQERVDSADQEGEEIERNRAEEDRLGEDEAQARHRTLQSVAARFLVGDDAGADREHGESGEEREREAAGEGNRRTGEVDHAAERRAGDGRDLLRGGGPGDRLRELLARHEQRRERLRCRAGKRPGRAREDERAIEGPRH
jgi:hypothetical protein